jgi:hypothetical protein
MIFSLEQNERGEQLTKTFNLAKLGGVVQLVEQQSPKLRVMGSSPVTSAKKILFYKRVF